MTRRFTRRASQDPRKFKGMDLPIRTLPNNPYQNLAVQCTPLSAEAAVFSIKPPSDDAKTKRAPSDIVLVIDVSGSMSSAAPLPDIEDKTSESAGLSILDLVKHASKTILETLEDNDRLALVTFSKDAKVCSTRIQLFPLTFSGRPRFDGYDKLQ